MGSTREARPALLGRLRARRRRWVKRTGKRLFRRLARFLALRSTVGDPVVFDPYLFPGIGALEADWKKVSDEASGLLAEVAALPTIQHISPDQARISRDESWRIYPLYAFGYPSKRGNRRCPETARLLRGIPGLQNAFFSVLLPGAEVPPHHGVTKAIIRAHLGLIVPGDSERCGMQLGGQRVGWDEGRCLVFDDTREHTAWNRTQTPRVVLLVDFVRPMRASGRALGALMLFGLRRTAYVRDILAREAAWDREQRGAGAQPA